MTELRERLDGLARLVGDDAAAERMLGRVGPMVHAVRRRRTVRQVGVSAAGLGTAAAVGLTGVVLANGGAGGRGGAGPAGSDASAAAGEHLVVPAGLECGALVTPGRADEHGLRLVAGLSGSIEAPVLSQTTMNDSDETILLEHDGAQQVLVLEDGRVVARAWGSTGGLLPPGSAIAGVGPARGLTLCAATVLDDGDYELVVAANTSSTPDQVTVLGEATTMVVSDGVASTPGYDSLVAELGVSGPQSPAPDEPPASADPEPDPVPFRAGSDACTAAIPGPTAVALRATPDVIGDIALERAAELVVMVTNTGEVAEQVGLVLAARTVVLADGTPVAAFTSEAAPLGPAGRAGAELELAPGDSAGYVSGMTRPQWCLSGVDRLADGDYDTVTMLSVAVDGVARSVVTRGSGTVTDGVLVMDRTYETVVTGGSKDPVTVTQP